MRCGECNKNIPITDTWFSVTHTKHDPTSDKSESTTMRVCSECYGKLYKSNSPSPDDYDLGHLSSKEESSSFPKVKVN